MDARAYERLMLSLGAWLVLLLAALAARLAGVAAWVVVELAAAAVALALWRWLDTRAPRRGTGLALAAVAFAAAAAALEAYELLAGASTASARAALAAAIVSFALALWRAGRRAGAGLALFAAPFAASALGVSGSLGAQLELSGWLALSLWAPALALVAGSIQEADHPATDGALHALSIGGRPRLARVAGLRDLLRPLPLVELRSDICDVVYLNWMVPSERVAELLPAPLALHRIGAFTALSILTYRHGGFGPTLLGPLRRALPSPCQSNWRLYVEPPAGAARRDAIYFFKTTLSMAPHVIGSRLLSDGLPAHLAGSFVHQRRGAVITTALEPGGGSAPDLAATVRERQERELPPDFERCFAGWEEAVRYLVEQNRAISVLGRAGAVIESRIDIPIRVEEVRPAAIEGAVVSRFLAPYVAGCAPFAFVVPRVPFRALGERVVARYALGAPTKK
jgi:hypothetical protein